MNVRHLFTSGRRPRLSLALTLLLIVPAIIVHWSLDASGQQASLPKLTLVQIEGLVSHGVPDSTMSAQIKMRGVAFTPDQASLDALRAKGAGPLTLDAIKELFPQATPNAGPMGAAPPSGTGNEDSQTAAVLRALQDPDCTERDQPVPLHSQLVFVLSPSRACWTPWLVSDGNWNRIHESGNLLIQLAYWDGTVGAAFEDGPAMNFSMNKPVRKIRFKSLQTGPVTVTLSAVDAGRVPRAAVEQMQQPAAPDIRRIAPIPATAKRVEISTAVADGMVIKNPMPAYPSIARAARVHGEVLLHVVISKQGTVKDVTIISGPAMLAPYAQEAVRGWLYRPYLLNNQPVEVETTVHLTFALGD